jgi:hypothetical protein
VEIGTYGFARVYRVQMGPPNPLDPEPTAPAVVVRVLDDGRLHVRYKRGYPGVIPSDWFTPNPLARWVVREG